MTVALHSFTVTPRITLLHSYVRFTTPTRVIAQSQRRSVMMWHRSMSMEEFTLVPVYDVANGLGDNISIAYLGVLVTMLLGAAFYVGREVIIRIEMDEAVKRIGDNIRAGNATSEEYYELAALLIRKKLYVQALNNLEKSISLWDDEEVELAQVYNAIGFCYYRQDKDTLALQNYKKAVELRPNYVTALNNLGDVYERTKKWKYDPFRSGPVRSGAVECRDSYKAYQEVLKVDAENSIALERADYLKKKLERLGIPA